MTSGTDPQEVKSDPHRGPSPIVCASCGRTLSDYYFEMNRTIVCEECRRSIEDRLGRGPGLDRLAKATLFGAGGLIIGTAIYSALLRFSPHDWSLVAVPIGYLVGKLVRKGSGGLGGLACRSLAVALTYLSLAMSYFTLVLLAIWEENQIARAIAITPGDVASILYRALGMPVVRMKDAPIQVAIVGFALWQAWRLNRPRRIVVTGPHQVDLADQRSPKKV